MKKLIQRLGALLLISGIVGALTPTPSHAFGFYKSCIVFTKAETRIFYNWYSGEYVEDEGDSYSWNEIGGLCG